MKKKPTISVVAISYNEEVDIPGFIEHLIGWVDEIVIIDDGSTDKTKEIAIQYGKKVTFIESQRSSSEYYSDQRNKGIDIAKSDWLLHMDIDERVSKELKFEILRAISSDEFEAYKFRRLNFFMHRPMKGGGWADWNQIHLAKKSALRFSGMFHETIELNINASVVGQLDEKMYHFNDDSYLERLRKSMTYQEEVLIQLEKKGKIVTLFNMGVAVSKEFFVKYILKRGLLDGTAGFISAFHSAFAVFKVYALLWEKQNKIERSQLEKRFIK